MSSSNEIAIISVCKNSSIFFQNSECEYYPCHNTDLEDFNCLFCFCPMYYTLCLGTPEYIDIKGKIIKDCSNCDFPHDPDNHSLIMEFLRLLLFE
jgi:Zn-finger protein